MELCHGWGRSGSRLTPRRQDAKKLQKGRRPLGDFAPLREDNSGIGRHRDTDPAAISRQDAKTRRSFWADAGRLAALRLCVRTVPGSEGMETPIR